MNAMLCASSGQPALTASPTSAQASDFRVSAVFDIIEGQLKQSGADYVKKVGGIFCFKVKKGSDIGVWVVDVKNGSGAVKFDPNGKGDVTITISDDDLIKLMSGTLNPQQAFFQGKLKIAGNMGLAMKMRELQPANLKSKL